ncbi:MAG TPA: tRNA (adenosine(37)-N6)-threonylcarbamoyltransferase complex ATPase subunit type 1 TsaE [Candidatus Manganitrophaceae bacterium]|nr:tRNA (adenosine(37)-N6)-threonylcarbamoyltransferase complex ATPase subunit type 1 TsaE [Candidatus Manganitrophaceae bacterium]
MEIPTVKIAWRRETDAPTTLTLLSDGPEATFRLGEFFGKEAVGGEVIGLIGPLGAGKTQWVHGLAKGLGVADPYISSPTFTLVHPHEGRLPLYHIDLYRLENAADIEAIGLDEFLETDGVAAVEWAEKGASFLPPERLMVEISYLEGSRRKIALAGYGARYKRWMDQIKHSQQWKIIEEDHGSAA